MKNKKIYLYIFVILLLESNLSILSFSNNIFDKLNNEKNNSNLSKIIGDIVRKTAYYHLFHRKIFNIEEKYIHPLLKERVGVFITITKDNFTVGCWGSITPNENNIKEEIIHNTIKALSKDYRFTPINKLEFPEIRIYVSIVGKIEQIDSISKLNPYNYGIMIKRGKKTGVLLPKEVMNIKQQISECKRKANIKEGEEFLIYRFQTIVFGPY